MKPAIQSSSIDVDQNCQFHPLIQRPRTSAVIYLLSLAATDLFFLVTQTSHWSLRAIYDSYWTRTIAKFAYQVHYINLLLNIWLVVCVSVDRYIAVCHPHKVKITTHKMGSIDHWDHNISVGLSPSVDLCYKILRRYQCPFRSLCPTD